MSSMNVNNNNGQALLLQSQNQNPNPQVENLNISQDEINKEKIRESTRNIKEGLVGKHLGTTKAGEGGEVNVTHFALLNNDGTEPNVELLTTFFSEGKFDGPQAMLQTAIETLIFLAQADISMEELFFIIHFIPAENDELKNKLLKLVTLLDKLITSVGDSSDGAIADALLFGDKMAAPENKAADKTIAELMASLFAGWEAQVNDAMDEEIDYQKALPEAKPFLMNLFDKAVLFALLLVEINRLMRESFNEIKESLTLSKEAINSAAIEGILKRGREAMAVGISASLGQAAMTIGGGSMQARASTKSGAALKSHNVEAPKIQKDITGLKGEIHSSKLTRDAPNVQSKSEQLGTREAELEGLVATKDIALKKAEVQQNWGMAVQGGSAGIATFINSIGEQSQSMTEASTRQAEQVAQVLSEVYQASDESTRNQKTQQDAALEMLRTLRESDSGIYAAIRM